MSATAIAIVVAVVVLVGVIGLFSRPKLPPTQTFSVLDAVVSLGTHPTGKPGELGRNDCSVILATAIG